MLKEKYDKMINRFESYYPYLFNQMVDWWPSGRSYITVKLDDGSLIEYDSMTDSIRTIQSSSRAKDVSIVRKDIGHNLKKLIFARGIPQSDIAEQCGITEAMLSRYTHGTSMPGIDKLYTLADVLGCRVIDIIGENYGELER